MVDYDFSSGEGTLRIRDLGTVVEFWVQAGYTNFNWDPLKFSFTANGHTYYEDIDYNTGSPWVKVGSVSVTSSQTVTFRLLTATGTSSLAGPTTVSRYLDRATVPDPPTAPTFSGLWSTYVTVSFNDGDNGGIAIDTRRIGYGTSSSAPQQYITSDRSTKITGLTPNKVYYFWAQTHNSKGWSALSARRSIETLSVPPAPSKPMISAVTQTSAHVEFTVPTDTGGTPITSMELAYNTVNSVTGATIQTVGKISNVNNLHPGNTYYFWARSKNAIGYGPWSIVASAKTLAGAKIKVGLVYKDAVPYVKDSGVWKVATPWGRQGGIWKRSIGS
jgi:hypothetical protein